MISAAAFGSLLDVLCQLFLGTYLALMIMQIVVCKRAWKQIPPTPHSHVASEISLIMWGAGAAAGLSATLVHRDWPVLGLWLVFIWWFWWRRRKRRRRALREAGAKARARIAAMLRKLADRAPARRPVPVPA